MKLVWNAIVKNESARIARCVGSLLPHIDGAVVLDTGSIDGTQELIKRLFEAADKPVQVSYTPFVSFSQARNEALWLARSSSLPWDYLIFADADMELVVDDPQWIDKLDGGLAYDVKQVAGSLTYWNRRLLSRAAKGCYESPTHEYLDVPTAGSIAGIWFRDHADGSNRTGKFSRDIALLETALKTETRPGLIERYTFYLAGSYYDIGKFEKAAWHYAKRVDLAGFDEERWYAQMRYAMCLGHQGNSTGFLRAMLQAYEMRPHRAETLYELAKHFRLQGDNYTSLMFSEAGLQLRYPHSDLLFVNDWIYKSGLREEYAICAYYDPLRRRQGANTTNKLALAGSVQAQANLFWYLQPLVEHVPSFQPQRMAFDAPDGYIALNPSVVEHAGQTTFLIRTVNYTITPEGRYQIRSADGLVGNYAPIRTCNFIGDPYAGYRELTLPANWPDPQYSLVRGFEDSRLFRWQGEFYTLSTVRELTPAGWCEQVLAAVDLSNNSCRYSDNWRRILPADRRHEKNWMPWVRAGELQFVYRLGTLLDLDGNVVFHDDTMGYNVDHISGGSQVIEVDERTCLAIVHEARTIPGRPNRYYSHRFVSFLRNGCVDWISPPFFFFDRQIEFCAGLALSGKKLLVGFGVRDCEAWTATMDVDEVIRFIYKDSL